MLALIPGVSRSGITMTAVRKRSEIASDYESISAEKLVAYRETVRKSAEGEGKHKKQSGGSGIRV